MKAAPQRLAWPTARVEAFQLILLNCAVAAGYRVLFITFFGTPEEIRGVQAALWSGLGLDASLLALGLAILTVLALVTRRFRLRVTLAGLWAFTGLNVVCALVNLFVFHERHQHLWEIVPANLERPHEMLVAFEPFAGAHPFVMAGGVLAIALGAVVASRHTRALAGQSADLWRPTALAVTVAVLGGLL